MGTKLWVGNLPKGVNTQEIEDYFSKYGTVKSVWVARKPAGFGIGLIGVLAGRPVLRVVAVPLVIPLGAGVGAAVGAEVGALLGIGEVGVEAEVGIEEEGIQDGIEVGVALQLGGTGEAGIIEMGIGSVVGAET